MINTIRTTTKITLLILALGPMLPGCAEKSPEALVASARQHLQKLDHKSAAVELKTALQKQPDNPEARLLLGESMHVMGDYASAEKEYKRARELGAPADRLLILYGRLLLDTWQYQRLLDDIMAVPTLGPQAMATVHAYRAHALLKLGQREGALQALAQGEALAPRHPEVLLVRSLLAVLARDLPEALRQTEAALQQDPRHMEALYNKAALHKLQKQDAEALKVYQNIVTLAPYAYQAHLAIARLQMGRKDMAAADKAIKEAERLIPKSPQVKSERALLELRRGNYDRALDAISQVLNLMPNHPPSLMLHAMASMARGHIEQSRRSAERLIALQPDNALATKLLAETHLKEGDAKHALGLLEPLLKRHPQDAGLLTLAGEAHMRQRAYATALQYLERAAALNPDDQELRVRLAAGQMNLGRDEDALAELEQAASASARPGQVDMVLIDLQLKRRDFDTALVSIGRVEKKQPENPVMPYMRALALIGKKDLPAARASLEKALSLDPTQIQSAGLLARLDLMDNKPDAARKRYEALLAKDPKHLQAMLALAELSLARQQEQEFRQWLEKAARSHPKAIQPRALLARYHQQRKEHNQALSLAREAVANNPGDPAALKLLGVTQRAAGDQDNALATFATLVKNTPLSADAHYTLATAQLAAGKSREGRASLQHAVSLEPDLVPALDALLVLDTSEGRFDAALKLARQIQAQAPASPMGHLREGDIHYTRQQYTQAGPAYRRAVERGAGSETMIKLHRVLTLAGNARSAEQELKSWLARQPNDAAVRIYAADLAYAEGRQPEALGHYEALLRQQPNHILALNNLAEIYRLAKDQRAIDVAERAYKLAPGRPEVLDTLGWILLGTGDVKRALPLLGEAAAKSPNAPSVQYHYAVAQARSGDKAGARKTLEKLIALGRLFPEREEARAALSGL